MLACFQIGKWRSVFRQMEADHKRVIRYLSLEDGFEIELGVSRYHSFNITLE